MRDVSKLDFIHEIVVWHESGAPNQPLELWHDCPSELHGKPVVYLPQTSPMKELAKYKACAKETRRGTSVCYFQVPQRDASGYLHSLWASFLRSPDALHTAVSATTYYLDQVPPHALSGACHLRVTPAKRPRAAGRTRSARHAAARG